MLVADGGGGYGGTDWTGMDVLAMWQAVENQDTTAHYQLLTGWQRSYELTLEHLGQVQNYRQSLAEAWPPETSAASAAYIQRLDDLIANLQTTYDAAVANHDAFASATLAISMSRDDVKKIYDEYTANQAKLEEFKSQPRPISKFPIPPQKPPVPDGRQEELNNQARTVMFGLSGEIMQAKSQIVKPALYDPDRPRLGGEVTENSTFVAPSVPAVATYDPASKAPNGPGSATRPAPAEVMSPDSGPNAPIKTAGHAGLVLGGSLPGSDTPTASQPHTGSLSPIGGAAPNIVPASPFLPLSPGMSSSNDVSSRIGVNKGAPSAGEGTRAPFGDGLIRPGVGGMPQSETRAMPPGAIIGGSPATGQNQPGPRTRAPSRVNPIGGVISPSNAERPGSLGRPAASAQPPSIVAGRADRRDTDEKTHRWDPDNPWETDEGVPPVLLPAKPPCIDPGPAIGLR
jgi:hypothetical protein